MVKNINSKAQVWISAVIYTLVAVVTVMLILNTGVPLLTEMKDRAVSEKVKEIMLGLDKQIVELASQGEGSQSSVSLDIKEGKVSFDNNEITWELETSKPIMSPRTKTNLGNLIISSNANVKAYELDDRYVMETMVKNNTFRVEINKKDSDNNWTFVDSRELLMNITHNGEDMPGNFTFTLNNDLDSINGTGYTKMYPEGNNSYLGSAKVVAHINSTLAEYDLEFRLESYADFLTIKTKNIKMK